MELIKKRIFVKFPLRMPSDIVQNVFLKVEETIIQEEFPTSNKNMFTSFM